jgi:hypothetical protein
MTASPQLEARRVRSSGASARTMSAASRSDSHAVSPSKMTIDARPIVSRARARSNVVAMASASRASDSDRSNPARA